jgi:3-deoxy-D-manno-octulosonic-acid transferase
MWRLIYNLCVWAILPLFAAFSLTRKKIRGNFLERVFPAPLKGAPADIVWIHAASLGEAVIAENLVSYMRGAIPNPFLITTNTYYTRDLLRKKLGDGVKVRSLPFDLSCSINRFMGASTFAALILIETEIWPNLIWIARSRRVPVIVVNGRISDATLGRYRRLAFFLKKVLSSVDVVLAQSEEQARRFVSLGLPPGRVISTGNLKYYRELEGRLEATAERHAATFGSIKERELPFIIPVIRGLKRRFPDLCVFVAPREMHLVKAIEEELRKSYRVTRYSAIKGSGPKKGDVVLVDTVGDLVDIYRESGVAFVGGSLAPYGGQNVLEPLFVGTPVVFGPYVDNFKAVAETIVAQGAGFTVQDGDGLLSVMVSVLGNPFMRQGLVDAGKTVLAIQKGVMEKAAGHILETIWKNSQSS